MSTLKTNIASVSNVLMIDDNVIELNVCESLLKSTFNCDVQSVKSVAGALDYLKKIDKENQVPDLIICDLNLPYLDGYDFVKEYGDLPDFVQKRSKLFLLSGSYNEEDVEYFQNADSVDRFLKKPLNAQDLLAEQ